MEPGLDRFDQSTACRLALFPLLDEVHFPLTELRLRVVEPDYRELIEEIHEQRGEDARIGTVLLKPDWAQDEDGDDVYTAGTAGRLIALESHDEGCDVVLRGEYRFEVEREIGAGPCREALVRPLTEPLVSELDPGVKLVRDALITCTANLAGELGERFPLPKDELFELENEDLPFEGMVNGLAARLDLTPFAKLRLLSDSLPQRARRLLSILEGRCQVLDTLRPFRHLERGAEYN